MINWISKFWLNEKGGDRAEHLLLAAIGTLLRLTRARFLPSE